MDPKYWPLNIHLVQADDITDNINIHMAFSCPHEMRTYGEAPVQRIVDFVREPAQPITFNPPVAFMTGEQAQRLLEDLWRLGFRPKNDGTPGQLAAMREHLTFAQGIAVELLDDKLGKNKNR